MAKYYDRDNKKTIIKAAENEFQKHVRVLKIQTKYFIIYFCHDFAL